MNKLNTYVIIYLFTLSTISCNGQNSGINSDDPASRQNGDVSIIEKKQGRDIRPGIVPEDVDFVYSARVSTPAVVHITTAVMVERRPSPHSFDIPEPFRDFFRRFEQGPSQPQLQRASGSGVILTPDGYIATNDHVVGNSDEIQVVLYDQRSYKAKLVGTDPSTDLALIKIDENELPFLRFGDSDSVQVGEWVLAVGNPFNLSSTVTAGIISAKARNINILRDRAAIESFLQTDAAVNPGNSGGALVNRKGKLLGILTAIATPTGVYAGYAFAIPAEITKKVIDDLLKYGVVQRACLGVTIRNLNTELQNELGLNISEGVFVDSVMENSAAEEAGIKPRDVIVSINNIPVRSAPKLQELIARQRPGDMIKVTVNRKGKEKTFNVNLKNLEGTAELVKNEPKEALLHTLGIQLKEVPQRELKDLGVKGGVQVTGLAEGKLRRMTNIREGFVITKVNGKEVSTVKDFVETLKDHEGGVMLEGVYPDISGVYYYAFGL